jgi:hypothetical protein
MSVQKIEEKPFLERLLQEGARKASELRDRIRSFGVRISVMDKLARKQLEVEPRQLDGRLLHQLSICT